MSDAETARWTESQWLAERARWLPVLNRNVPWAPKAKATPETSEHDYLW